MQLDIETLTRACVHRSQTAGAYKRSPAWSLAQWMMATFGELGEAANLLKKIDRGDPNQDELRKAFGYELADVIIYTALLAHYGEVDLPRAIADKFNMKSEEIGHPSRIRPDGRWDDGDQGWSGGDEDQPVGVALAAAQQSLVDSGVHRAPMAPIPAPGTTHPQPAVVRIAPHSLREMAQFIREEMIGAIERVATAAEETATCMRENR